MQELSRTTAQSEFPIWADQGVDFGALHVVELLHSFLDLGLGGLDVDEEHQRVDLLNLLHGGLRGHRALDDPILVQLVPSRFYGLSRVLGIPGLCQGLGFVEANLGADLLHLRQGAEECEFMNYKIGARDNALYIFDVPCKKGDK